MSCLMRLLFFARELLRRERSYHHSLAISAQSIHEYLGERRLAIRHPRAVTSRQRRYALAQTRQRLVDRDALSQSLATRLGLLDTFAARQIYQLNERTALHHRAVLVLECLLEHELHNRVCTTKNHNKIYIKIDFRNFLTFFRCK